MNILHICGTFPPAHAYGGPPRSVHNLALSLSDRGHNVTVYTTDAKDKQSRISPDSDGLDTDKLEIRRFRNVSNKLAWKNIQLPPKMLLALANNSDDFDIIHSHEYRSAHTVFAHMISDTHGIPHIAQPRGSVPRFGKNRTKYIFDKLIGGSILRSADKIIASSNIESNRYYEIEEGIDNKKVEHIPNGLSFEKYNKLPTENLFRKKYNITKEEQVVLFLGRLHQIKNCRTLINAFSNIQDNSNMTLVLAGPDDGDLLDLREMSENLGIEQDVLFTGGIYDQMKLSALTTADVFVLPSEYESFGNVVVEAMACGTFPIISEECGVSEWVPNKYSKVASPEQKSLESAIVEGLQAGVDPNELREFSRSRFSWPSIAEQTEQIYSSLVK